MVFDPFQENVATRTTATTRYPIWPYSAIVAVAGLVALQNIVHTVGLSSTVVLMLALVVGGASLWGLEARKARGVGDGGLLPSLLAVGLLGSYPVFGSFYFLAERSGLGSLVTLVLVAGVIGVPFFNFCRRLAGNNDDNVPQPRGSVVAFQLLLITTCVHLVAGPLLGLWVAASIILAISAGWFLYSSRSKITAWLSTVSAVVVVLVVNIQLTSNVVIGTSPFATYTILQGGEGRRVVVNEQQTPAFSDQLLKDITANIDTTPGGITLVVDGIYGLGVPQLFQTNSVVFVERDLAMPVALTLVEERSIPLDTVVAGSLSQAIDDLPLKPSGIVLNLAFPGSHEQLNLAQVEAAIRGINDGGVLVWIHKIDALQSLAEIATRYAREINGCTITLYTADELAGLFCKRSPG